MCGFPKLVKRTCWSARKLRSFMVILNNNVRYVELPFIRRWNDKKADTNVGTMERISGNEIHRSNYYNLFHDSHVSHSVHTTIKNEASALLKNKKRSLRLRTHLEGEGKRRWNFACAIILDTWQVKPTLTSHNIANLNARKFSRVISAR